MGPKDLLRLCGRCCRTTGCSFWTQTSLRSARSMPSSWRARCTCAHLARGAAQPRIVDRDRVSIMSFPRRRSWAAALDSQVRIDAFRSWAAALDSLCCSSLHLRATLPCYSECLPIVYEARASAEPAGVGLRVAVRSSRSDPIRSGLALLRAQAPAAVAYSDGPWSPLNSGVLVRRIPCV